MVTCLLAGPSAHSPGSVQIVSEIGWSGALAVLGSVVLLQVCRSAAGVAPDCSDVCSMIADA